MSVLQHDQSELRAIDGPTRDRAAMNHTDADTGSGADAGDPNAAAHEGRGLQAFAVTTAPAVTTVPVARIQYLARRIYVLGERPLAELFIELAAGRPLDDVLERFARIAPLADFIRALDGERLPPPRAISGERR
jgi:hypothetical protein